MPRNLVESATYDTPISVPTPGDGGTSNSVNTALQGITDRTAYLKTITDIVNSGIYQIRMGLTSEMQNTPADNGQWFFDYNQGLFYAWDGTGADGVITFENLVTAGKLWYRYDWNADLEGNGVLIGPCGNSPATPSGKIPSTVVQNSLISVGYDNVGSPSYTNDTVATTEVSNYAWPNLVNGDIIQGELMLVAYMSGTGPEWGAVHGFFNDGATSNLEGFDLTVTSHVIYSPWVIPFQHVVSACPTPDTVGIILQGRSLAGGVALNIAGLTGTYSNWIRWRIYRP